jgi:pimeloyl-ACP methyl ester carboxylesterase
VAAMNNPPRLIDAGGITVELRRGGSGIPLLVIHGELGVPGWLESFAHLAEHYDVIVPSLPGYSRSTRPDWVMGVHDLAAWVRGSPGMSICARR